MRQVLLDTNVLSEVIKKVPSESVMAHLRALPAEAMFTSAVCVMEMYFGAARHPHGELLWKRIERDVLSRVAVLPIGDNEAKRAGAILANLEVRGERIGVEDVLIAATALERGLVVSTRNLRHLGRVKGLVVENWWSR